ncbi:MAG: bifunctional diaminohydroxyphosphoribosylaminopyrimidine deaminase/5-amino-6-(5-phosphoribosylamino)uracil reductase RibD [bacterium]
MSDEIYIKECIELAKLGQGKVSPNPLVGAVVLSENNEIAGKGYHEKYGEAHAEINALNQAGERAKNGTLYVNLEPCSHFGKTPPCADRIIKSGIKKLVVGMIDPNPLVSGLGLKKIRESGIEVKEGVLEKECKKLNEIFIKYIIEQQPFIAIKTATTIDGKIATKIKSSKWITSEAARAEVQSLRNKYDAILTGSGTIISDNPGLICKNQKSYRNPIRVIIDSQLRTPPNSKVYENNNTRVIVASSVDISSNKTKIYPENVEIIKCPLTKDKKINLNYLIDKLYQYKIASILIEAGGKLNGAFIKNNLVDKFYFFIAPKILGDNEAYSMIEGFNIKDIKESLNLKFEEVKRFSPDIMIEGYL